MSVEEKLFKLRKEVVAETAEYRLLSSQREELEAEIAQLNKDIQLHSEVALVLASIGEEQQTTLQAQIESLVTEGLQFVFEEPYSFHLVQTVKGNSPQVEFVVRTTFPDGSTLDTETKARGGGINSVIGILLRIIVKLLDPSQTNVPLILDEATSMVSIQYLPRLCEFLRELVDSTPIQVVLATHQDMWIEHADIVYRLNLDGKGHSIIKRE